jgi:hypothetical protein
LVLQTFSKHRTAGDLVGLIGIGRGIGTDSVFTRTGRYQPFVEPREDDIDFQKMLRLTSPRPDTLAERGAEKFFPGADGEYLDLPLGLAHAYDMLARDKFFQSSQNFVFLVTGGLTNCQRVNPNEPPPPLGTPQCTAGYGDHTVSYEEILDEQIQGTGRRTFQGDDVRLNVILAGNNAAPHTIVIRQPGTDRCMDPEEMRLAGYPAVLSSDAASEAAAFNGIGSGANFQNYLGAAWRLSSAAQATGGLFLPLRTNSQRCSAISFARCPPVEPQGFSESIQKACALSNPPAGGSLDQAVVKGPQFAAANPPVPPAAYDGAGRIYCDPLCRDRGGNAPLQMSDDLEEYFSPSSLSLVDDPKNSR